MIFVYGIPIIRLYLSVNYLRIMLYFESGYFRMKNRSASV